MKNIRLMPVNLNHPKINSASSLITCDKRIFVCCDDQYGLYEWHDNHWSHHKWKDAPELPKGHAARKKLKPDFEALLGPLENNLLIVPSGSKPNRQQALMFDLDSHVFYPVELNDFFESLAQKVKEINLEGAATTKDHFLFMNRGVGVEKSTLIKVNARTFEIESTHPVDFGAIKRVPLHGAELSIHDQHLYVLAVAETTSNSYDDGTIMGSGLFKLSLESFEVQSSWLFDRPIKTEGLCRWQNKWLVTTDPDGVGHSEFFTFTIPKN